MADKMKQIYLDTETAKMLEIVSSITNRKQSKILRECIAYYAKKKHPVILDSIEKNMQDIENS